MINYQKLYYNLVIIYMIFIQRISFLKFMLEYASNKIIFLTPTYL